MSALETGKAFHAENATKPGVITTASGLQYLVLTEGTGRQPKATDTVLETRAHNILNRLTQIGGAGSTIVEGALNEYASVLVNNKPAELHRDSASGGYRYRRLVPVSAGTNTVTVQAKDVDQPQQNTTTKSWPFTVPPLSRSFTYDDNGNTLSDGHRTMTWDVKNRLRTVTKNGTTWKWDYDYLDRRVKEYEYPAGTTSGSAYTTPTKLFIWSGNEIVQERAGNNTITRTHYSGGFSDGPSPITGTKYQTLTDHLGHIREVLTATGALAARYDYTPFQGPVKVSGTLEATFQTIGRYYHHAGSGLEMALYRAYDPELGRWLLEDPIGESGGLNLYGYVGNEPLSLVDTLGLSQEYPKSCVPASAAKAGSLATGKSIPERQMRKAISPNHNWWKNGTSVSNAATALNSVGVAARVIPYDQINKALAKGPVIVVVRTSPTTTHAVVCTGRDEKGNYKVWNPDPPKGLPENMKITPNSILPDQPAELVPCQ